VATAELDLASFTWADWADDPYPLYRRLRDERPVYHDERNGTYVLTRYDDAYGVLADHRRFSNVPLAVLEGRAIRFSPLRENDRPRHTFLRKIVLPMLTPAAMRDLEPYLQGLAKELLDAAEQHDVVEASSALGIPLPGRVTLDVLGLPVEQHARFKSLVMERHRLLTEKDGRVVPLGGDARTIEDVRGEMWGIVAPVIEARRAEPRDDVISLIVAAQDEHGREEISDDDFLDLLGHLLTGGFETTQHLIELLVSFLADRPDLWAALRADRSLLEPAIEEMLRWESPVQSLFRRATEEVEIQGVRIPANGHVTVVYGSANRDEREFEEPDEFRLDRDLKRHLAFSFGIHYCVGAPVTRFEVRALFEEMLDRYPRLERAGPSERNPERSPRLVVGKMRGWDRVPVRFLRD
jgi:cytochrome P450